MTPDISYRSSIQIGLQISRWRTELGPCKGMAVSQAFIFHFKCYSILNFAVCQLLCWASRILLTPFAVEIPPICWQRVLKASYHFKAGNAVFNPVILPIQLAEQISALIHCCNSRSNMRTSGERRHLYTSKQCTCSICNIGCSLLCLLYLQYRM